MRCKVSCSSKIEIGKNYYVDFVPAELAAVMPWHPSKSDPRKVYDSLHEAVCVCQNQEQATLIVEAVNALGAPDAITIKLREPAKPGFTYVSRAEGCCGKVYVKASLSGELDGLRPLVARSAGPV